MPWEIIVALENTTTHFFPLGGNETMYPENCPQNIILYSIVT
jgi:hypothetical protein